MQKYTSRSTFHEWWISQTLSITLALCSDLYCMYAMLLLDPSYRSHQRLRECLQACACCMQYWGQARKGGLVGQLYHSVLQLRVLLGCCSLSRQYMNIKG